MFRFPAFGLNIGYQGLFLGWSPGDLRDLEKYSQEGLRGYTVDVVNQVFLEEERRVVETGEFLSRLCLLDRKCTLWHLLWQSGGVRRFTEIQESSRRVGISGQSTVSKYLGFYLELGLAVKHPNGCYQMKGPIWLERE